MDRGLVHFASQNTQPGTADDCARPAPFSVGDRVTCIRDNSNAAGCKSVLRRGETYTVSAVVEQPWGWGLDLTEKPSRGRALYAPNRFVPATTALPADSVGTDERSEGVNP